MQEVVWLNLVEGRFREGPIRGVAAAESEDVNNMVRARARYLGLSS